MLDARYLYDNFEAVRDRLNSRGCVPGLDRFKELHETRRDAQKQVEGLRNRRNLASEETGRLKKAGLSQDDLETRAVEIRLISQEIKTLEERLSAIEEESRSLLLNIPNIPHETVPTGTSDKDNKEIKKWGEITDFGFTPKPHWDIGESLDILDFERGAKITGARFTLYKRQGAQLERALINFMLDLHTRQHGYSEVLPPFLVNRESMTGTGQLPKFEDDLFKIEGADYFLIPTAEVPVTNIHSGEILKGDDLPIKYTAYTPCFRKEAGSYGKDTRGLIRQHQFNKVELVKFSAPERSYQELEALLLDAEDVLQKLELPYRVVSLCTGDIGFSSAKTYDIEVWLPGQGVYREISSCSNFSDFQARRANIRFKRDEKGKTEYVHTLNGSGLAVGRTLVAILENYQQKDGTVNIPRVLQTYMGGLERIV